MKPFVWRKTPSESGASLGRTKTAQKFTVPSIKLSKPVFTTSIATPEKFKQRHGTGKSASV